MSDAALRRAERDDPAAYARQLARAGRWRELRTSDLAEQRLASSERADLAHRVLASDWADRDARRGLIREAAALLGPTLPARLGADYAARLPQGPEGRRAIAAARAWAEDPTEERREAARDAAADAATAHAATAAAWAAATAAWAAANAAATYAAAYANAAYAHGAAAAAYSAYAADNPAHEWEWQKSRLVRYLVAPDWPTPVEIVSA